MEHEEALKWYKQQWEADHRRWEEEKKQLQQRLEEQAAEIMRLKHAVAKQDQAAYRSLEERARALEQSLKEERQARKKYQELASKPVLGADFFHHLAQSLEFWDQTLMEEAQHLKASSIEAWLGTIWKAREAALSEALMGGEPDWRKVRTGLVLEWALLAWLEGEQSG